MNSDDIELRMRCLELAVRIDASDIVAQAQAFLDFAEGKASAEEDSADG